MFNIKEKEMNALLLYDVQQFHCKHPTIVE
jgi:hypothetical protein